MAAPRLGNIDPSKTAFFLCDMQEKFRPVIKFFKEILEIAEKLVDATRILDVHLVVTEQYPKGLGKTVPEIKLEDHPKLSGPFEKTKFTMLTEEVLAFLQQNSDVEHIVVFGIETHVCVQQTVIELLEKNYQVHVVADACSSRTQMDRKFALERFRQCGAFVTTSDAILLQLIGDKNHAKFKEIQKLIMKTAPDSGL